MTERRKSRIPRFKNYEEEAAFWDSHSLTEFEDELQVIKVEVARPLGHILGVRLDAKTIDKLADLGRKKGIGPSTLARIWLMERLSQIEEHDQEKAAKETPIQAGNLSP